VGVTQTSWRPIVSNREAIDAEFASANRQARRYLKTWKWWQHFDKAADRKRRRMKARLTHLIEVVSNHPDNDPWWDQPYNGSEF
jgi:hypothetical protein